MAIDTTTSVDVQTLTPFKKFIMTIGNLPTSYLESMTYAELLMWFCNYLQETVIPTVNNNAEAVEELQGLYEELKSYVDNYFDNLDVQEEINKKLDQMAQDGTLTSLITTYLTPIVEEQNQKINTIENKVNSVASGSPKGVYSTVSDLETDDPDHDDIYLVLADGKWYYYDTSDTAWAAGGTYQGTSVSTSDPTIADILNKLTPLYNLEYNKKDIQDVIYPAVIGRLSNAGKITSSQTYGYTSKFFYAKAGSYFYIENTTDYRIRIGRYSSPNTANCISASQSGQTSYTVENDGWYLVSVFYVDSTQTATSSIMEELDGYVYNDLNAYVYDNTTLNNAINNPTIKNIYVLNDITVSQRLNSTGEKHIFGNGHKLTGSASLLYLLYINEGNNIIENLILNGSQDDVIYVGGSSNVWIKNCEIYYSYENDGIGVHGSANCYVYDSILHDNCDEGLSSHDTSYAECYNVTAYNNGYEVGTTTPSDISFGGLHFGGSKMGKAVGCTCYNNDRNGIGFITIDNNYSSSAKCVCSNNICYNNTDTGIRFGGATNITCFDNMCYSNDRGILFYEKSTHGNTGYIGDNSVFNNTTGQITVWSGGDDGLHFKTPLS